MAKNIFKSSEIFAVLIILALVSGCACNPTWKDGALKGAALGAAMGGVGGAINARDHTGQLCDRVRHSVRNQQR